MTTRAEQLRSSRGGLYNQYDKVLGIATTGSFVTALTIELVPVRESTIVIHNNAGGDLDYQILGNADHLDDIVAPTGTDDDDKGWVLLGSGSIATGVAPSIETLTNPYTQLVIQIKHSSSTTDADIWHRGEN